MTKQSKTQISLLFALGLMTLCQVGIALYRGRQPQVSFCELSQRMGGSAKAFGLVIPHGKHFSVASVKELDSVFKTWDFDLKKAKTEGKAPRLYLAKLPKDMSKKKRSSNRTFIKVLLPHILKANEQILVDRARLLDMQKRQKEGGHLRKMEKKWLRELAATYRCKSTKIESLLVHVDAVPPSLALAQAILETGGGTSLAAINKNSTFGHMQTKNKVAKFESLLANVEAYIINLNRHAAYASFRKIRADLRAKKQNLSGYQLAVGLKKYSVRGDAYIRDLQKLINARDLETYNHMTLDHHKPL